MKKIIFVLPSLNKGGAEKVLYTVYNNLNGFNKKLILFNYSPKRDDNVIAYGTPRLRQNIFRLIRDIRNEKPDIVMASHLHINAVLIMLKMLRIISSKVVVRQSFTLSARIHLRLLTTLSKFYKNADMVIFQTNSMREDFIEVIGDSFKKSEVIYNPVDTSRIDNQTSFREDSQFLLAVGRLHEVKNFDYLIKRYHKQDNFLDLPNLYIVGEGPERENLEKLINSLNLTQKIKLMGVRDDIDVFYRNTVGLVITSKNEGLPNVLLEGISHGCNVQVLKHPGGTEEIMKLLDLEQNFVDEIDLSFQGVQQTNEYHIRKLHNNFSKEIIVEKYYNAFNNLIARS